MVNRLEDELGTELPATLMFDFPTTKAIAAALLAQLPGDTGSCDLAAEREVQAMGPVWEKPTSIAGKTAERKLDFAWSFACQ